MKRTKDIFKRLALDFTKTNCEKFKIIEVCLNSNDWSASVPACAPNTDGGLSYQNFVSAAVGIAIAIAFVRGNARKESATIGNFWVDFLRANLYVLLSLCLVTALVLVSQGMIQDLNAYDTATLVDKIITVETDVKDADGNVVSYAKLPNELPKRAERRSSSPTIINRSA